MRLRPALFRPIQRRVRLRHQALRQHLVVAHAGPGVAAPRPIDNVIVSATLPMNTGWLRTVCSTRAATFSPSVIAASDNTSANSSPAEARAGVADAHLGVDALRHLTQHAIPCQMSVLVV